MKSLRIASFDRGEPVTIFVNGCSTQAYTGETVHAALLAAGYTILRKPEGERPTGGVFCGMGICCGCLVTIDGRRDQQACMRHVTDGMEIAIDGR